MLSNKFKKYSIITAVLVLMLVSTIYILFINRMQDPLCLLYKTANSHLESFSDEGSAFIGGIEMGLYSSILNSNKFSDEVKAIIRKVYNADNENKLKILNTEMSNLSGGEWKCEFADEYYQKIVKLNKP